MVQVWGCLYNGNTLRQEQHDLRGVTMGSNGKETERKLWSAMLGIITHSLSQQYDVSQDTEHLVEA